MTNLQNFLIRRNILEDLDKVEVEDLSSRIFTIAMGVVLKNFDFAFEKIQLLNEQSRYISVQGESEWFFDDQERAINCFFPVIHDEELNISFIYKDQQHILPLEKNYLYFLPSWMSYRFISNKDKNEIKIAHFWFFSEKKIKNKENNTWW